MRRRTLLISLRMIRGTQIALVLAVVLSLALVIIADANLGDSIALEAAAAVLIATIVALFVLPARLTRLNRAVERELLRLAPDKDALEEGNLGSLGTAIQEYYRLLRRSALLKRGRIEAQAALIEYLIDLSDHKIIVLGAQGRLHYRSREANTDTSDGETDSPATQCVPSVRSIATTLVAGGDPGKVVVNGTRYYCYGVFGPVILRRVARNAAALEATDALAYIVLSDRELPGAARGVRPPARGSMPIVSKNRTFTGWLRLFGRGKGR